MSGECGCSRPALNGHCCPYCFDELEKLVAELPALVGLLYDHMGGQVRFNQPSGGGRAQRSTMAEDGTVAIETGLDLPVNATTASTLLKDYLHRTTRLLMDAGAAHPLRLPADEHQPMARFLYTHLPSLRRLPGVYDLKEELRALTSRVMRLVDKPAGRLYAGRCSVETDKGECPEELYATRAKPFILCKRCGHRHEVAERQQVMREAAEVMWLTAKEMRAIFPTFFGVPLNPATFRKWRERGKLEVMSITHTGEELYVCGQILDMAVEAAARTQAKAG